MAIIEGEEKLFETKVRSKRRFTVSASFDRTARWGMRDQLSLGQVA